MARSSHRKTSALRRTNQAPGERVSSSQSNRPPAVPVPRDAAIGVVGAGVIGVACAYEMAARGYRVTLIDQADLVIMESTYGDRLHRSWDETLTEIQSVVENTTKSRGNILIPAFAVGRTQEILYMLARHHREWNLERWRIFLDSPLAIEATRIFARHSDLFDEDMTDLWQQNKAQSILPNLHISRTSNQSMALNRIHSGAIIIAGSGMCSGGRIKHHLKHNIWRRECHVIITGFQARGTLGRMLVDGARHIRLWGEAVRVAASIHTVGGLSAHADQQGLKEWYSHFDGRPPLVLVHGESSSLESLGNILKNELNAPVTIAKRGQVLDLV